MCIKIVERYAVCQCIYTTHAVDPCSRVGLRDHNIILKEVLVGYTCPRHSATGAKPSSSSTYQPSFPDSGYGSGGYTKQHRAEYRRWWAKTKTTLVLVGQRSDCFFGGSRDWGKIGVCPLVMGVCSMAMWSYLGDIGKNMGKGLWGAGCFTWNLIVPIGGSFSGYFIGNIILLQGQSSQSCAHSLRPCISSHSLHLPTPHNPPFQNAATQHTQTWLGTKILLAERGISMRDIFFMWAWHLDEVRADTVWGQGYDIHGILGVEVGYWKRGFFPWVHLFRCTLWVAFISLIRALF